MLTNSDLDPEWKLDGTVLAPIMTDLAAAPECLLKFVRCKCKLTSKSPCGTNLCSCRKNGLKCVTACGDCRGESCKNSEEIILGLEEENMGADEENAFPLNSGTTSSAKIAMFYVKSPCVRL